MVQGISHPRLNFRNWPGSADLGGAARRQLSDYEALRSRSQRNRGGSAWPEAVIDATLSLGSASAERYQELKTPFSLRGRNYAGSVTAAVVERIFAEGKTAICLYTDQRNPASNRCYAKLGFEPACLSWHYPRVRR